jgi:hypothetical protein
LATELKQQTLDKVKNLTDLILQNNAMLSVSLDAMAELLASSSKKTMSEARSSLAKTVEHMMEILKGKSKP